MRRRRISQLVETTLVAGLALLSFGAPARAELDPEALLLSPDITVELGGTLVHDHDSVWDGLGSNLVAIDLGPLPVAAAVDAHHRISFQQELFSLETAVSLPGGVVAEDADIILWDGSGYSVHFDGSAHGLPRGVGVDAVSRDGAFTPNLLLSFDTTVSLGGLTVDDEDVVAFDGTDFSLFFDGSAAGLDPALDVDAADYATNEQNEEWLALSLDGSGLVDLGDGYIPTYQDEDVLAYELNTGQWDWIYTAQGLYSEWKPADVQSVSIVSRYVPEPGKTAMLLSGAAMLGILRRPRRRRQRLGFGSRSLVTTLVLLLGASAGASDGAIEINQARALQGNVTPGDTAGFPVTLSEPGAYVVTSNLVPPSDLTAIEIDTNAVHIDLNGFALIGTSVCTGSGVGISCSAQPTGSGVRATTVGSIGNARNSSLRNGVVRGFGWGIQLGNHSSIESVTASENQVGIGCINGCSITHSVISRNGVSGLSLSLDGLVSDNLIVGNGPFGGIQVTNNSVVRGNVVVGNAGPGIWALDSSVSENVVALNDGPGIEKNPDGLVTQNVVVENVGLGLELLPGAGYVENVIDANLGGTVSGGVGMIHNLCDGGSCP